MSSAALRVEGYVIVSADGRLTDETHRQPDALRFDADHRFLLEGLSRAALIVHGRHSGDSSSNARRQRRVIVTRKVADLARDPHERDVVLWNPKGAVFDDAAAMSGVAEGAVAVIGGPDVYALFLERYDTFWLSQAHRVQLPDGSGCFPGVPPATPQQVLAAHGLIAGKPRMLDADNAVDVTPWRRDQASP